MISKQILTIFILFYLTLYASELNADSSSHNEVLVTSAFEQAHHEMISEFKNIAKQSLNKGNVVQLKLGVSTKKSGLADAASLHLSLTRTSPTTELIHNSFQLALRASRILKASNSTATLKLRAPPKFCPFNFDTSCDASSKYRQIDGSCNNLGNGIIGRGNTPYKRILKPAYDDKIDQPRKTSVSGDPLPNPRSISLSIHDPMDTPASISHLGVMFGQYVDHDFALTASTGIGSTPLKCTCGSSNQDCVNIPTPSEELLNDQDCEVLTRSGASFDKFDCTLGQREQTNMLTHWLDMSQTYGSDTSQMNKLRSFSRGKLKISRVDVDGQKKDFMPPAKSGTCIEETDEQMCFESGDTRTSQNMMLVSIHTVWLREHNRVAVGLRRLNPSWTDEDLFQEAKRIVVAEYQHVLYNEWLPIIVGDSFMQAHGLTLQKVGHFMGYDESVNPHLSTEFATAAFRFGHTLIRSTISKTDESLTQTSNLTLTNIMLRPVEAFTNGGLDSICRGLLIDPGTSFDTHFTDELQNHLFETSAPDASTKRFSLSAINIMRGRDHGIAPYNEFRESAKLNRAKSFDDFFEIPELVRSKLKQIYTNVDDIDAFTGGTSETPMTGALIGPTFATFVARQFRELKVGDRYWYENGHDKITRFTLEQLAELRKSTMARIMCDNLDLKVIQSNAFLPASSGNPLVSCASLKRFSLKSWKNEPLNGAIVVDDSDTTTTTTTTTSDPDNFFV